MSTRVGSRGPTPERIYRLLLLAYPPAFRSGYGREMTLAFRDECRAKGTLDVRFWAAMLWDVARSAPGLRAEAMREWWDGGSHTRRKTMRPMAILAFLIGTFEVVNAVAEAWAGRLADRDPWSLLSVMLVIAAGAVLVALGVALLRRAATARWVPGAAAACLAVFLLSGLVDPWMSIASRLLGTGFSLALLGLLFTMRRRRPPAPLAS